MLRDNTFYVYGLNRQKYILDRLVQLFIRKRRASKYGNVCTYKKCKAQMDSKAAEINFYYFKIHFWNVSGAYFPFGTTYKGTEAFILQCRHNDPGYFHICIFEFAGPLLLIK